MSSSSGLKGSFRRRADGGAHTRTTGKSSKASSGFCVQGLPLATGLTAGPRHETIAFTDLMNEVSGPCARGQPRKRPEAVAGNRAYDADWIRQGYRDRGIESVIPAQPRKGPGRPPTCDSRKHSGRKTVERWVGRLKERR